MMPVWNDYLACGGCHALQGEACYDLSAGGPQALPEQRREVPHTGRPVSARLGGAIRKPRAQSARSVPANPVRRAAKKTAGRAASWQAVADRQRAKRETR